MKIKNKINVKKASAVKGKSFPMQLEYHGYIQERRN